MLLSAHIGHQVALLRGTLLLSSSGCLPSRYILLSFCADAVQALQGVHVARLRREHAQVGVPGAAAAAGLRRRGGGGAGLHRRVPRLARSLGRRQRAGRQGPLISLGSGGSGGHLACCRAPGAPAHMQAVWCLSPDSRRTPDVQQMHTAHGRLHRLELLHLGTYQCTPLGSRPCRPHFAATLQSASHDPVRQWGSPNRWGL